MDYIAFVFTTLSIIGTIANSLKKRWCFYVWGCTNIFWCFYNVSSNAWAQALLYAFNFLTCIIGLYKWRSTIDGPADISEVRNKNVDCYQTPKATGEYYHEIYEVPYEIQQSTKQLCPSFALWQIKQRNSRVKHLAYNASSQRTRKKNKNRLVREYKKSFEKEPVQ